MKMNSYSNKYDSCEYLFELAEVLGKQTDYEEILRLVSARTSAIFKSDITSILMINPSSDQTYKTIFKKEKNVDKKQYSIAQSIIIGWVILNKKGVLIRDLKSDTRFKEDIFAEFPLKSAMCVPLFCNDKMIGYMVVMNKDGKEIFNDDDFNILRKIAVISAPYLRNVQRIKEFFNIPLPDGSLLNKYRVVGLIGKSKSFIELLHSIEAASNCDVRVVLEGETGTGKELVVRAIHNFSSRSGYPFITVDCGAIPANLVESELFGHVRGAFTGANYDKPGLIRDANKGTLFLDEICNLPIDIQAKLLRVLQQGEVRPVGTSKNIPVDVRIIAASSKNLLKMVEEKEFREDLYYRLMVYPIKMPNLNERKSDIPVLANHFLKRFASEQNKKVAYICDNILSFLKNKKWNGNIRELENYMERLVTSSKEDVEELSLSSINGMIKDEIIDFLRNSLQTGRLDLNNEISNFEKNIICNVLDENEWNQSEAARKLDIPEQTLRYKMKKLGISNKIKRSIK